MHDEIMIELRERRCSYIFLLLLKFKDSHFDDTITGTTVLIYFFEVQGQSF